LVAVLVAAVLVAAVLVAVVLVAAVLVAVVLVAAVLVAAVLVAAVLVAAVLVAAVLVAAVLVAAVLGRDCVSYAIKKNSNHPFLKHNGENTIPCKANARNAWQKRGRIEKQEKQRHDPAWQWIVQWQLSRRENLSRVLQRQTRKQKEKRTPPTFTKTFLEMVFFYLDRRFNTSDKCSKQLTKLKRFNFSVAW